MYNKLFQTLNAPPIYTQRDMSIWQDSHISEQLLNAHLDPHQEGASRNHNFIDRSVTWISQSILSAKEAVILDVGCGPGLYAEGLASAGCRVTGVDFSQRSIRHAQKSSLEKDLPIRYFCQNYLDMNFRSGFDAAIMIYCDYGALSPADRQRLLDRIRLALKPGGKLLLDVFSMKWYDDAEEGQTWEHCPSGGFWRRGEYLELKSSLKYEEKVFSDQYRIVTASGVSEYFLWNTCFTKKSLAQECRAADFHNFQFFSDVAGSPYSQNSHTIAALMEAADE